MAQPDREPEQDKPGRDKLGQDNKAEKRIESPWVTVARYSEIGFIIPMTVIIGYFFGRVADHFLHTHWLYLFGIVFGAVAGFVSMIRQALASSKEPGEEPNDDEGQNGGAAGGKRHDGDGEGPHA